VSHVSARDRRDSRDVRDIREEEAAGRAQGLNTGWTVFSYLLSGMAAYGLIGWLIGRAVHVEMLFPIGMLVGLAISIGFIIWRYGRPSDRSQPRTQTKTLQTGMSATTIRRASHRRGTHREETSR
jgi:F0F1-type ATP synthase assembly protein I